MADFYREDVYEYRPNTQGQGGDDSGWYRVSDGQRATYAGDGIFVTQEGRQLNRIDGNNEYSRLTTGRYWDAQAELDAKRAAAASAATARERAAAQRAVEEAARRQAEEAARIAAEQEAARRAAEQAAAQRAAEEAARIAAAQRAAEEAARVAAEQEAARQAAAQRAAEEAARQEAARRAAEEAARQAAAQPVPAAPAPVPQPAPPGPSAPIPQDQPQASAIANIQQAATAGAQRFEQGLPPPPAQQELFPYQPFAPVPTNFFTSMLDGGPPNQPPKTQPVKFFQDMVANTALTPVVQAPLTATSFQVPTTPNAPPLQLAGSMSNVDPFAPQVFLPQYTGPVAFQPTAPLAPIQTNIFSLRPLGGLV